LQKLYFLVQDVALKDSHELYRTQMFRLVNDALKHTSNTQVMIRSQPIPPEGELLTYGELVKINKSLIDSCSELMRLYVLRNEAIESAIEVEDLLIS
jgi:hypothetical protein